MSIGTSSHKPMNLLVFPVAPAMVTLKVRDTGRRSLSASSDDITETSAPVSIKASTSFPSIWTLAVGLAAMYNSLDFGSTYSGVKSSSSSILALMLLN